MTNTTLGSYTKMNSEKIVAMEFDRGNMVTTIIINCCSILANVERTCNLAIIRPSRLCLCVLFICFPYGRLGRVVEGCVECG